MTIQMNPKYPIYIISKGRWESRITSKVLEKMRVPYRIVIEPQEYDQYASVIKKDRILTLPFSNLGQGSIPARNWVWEHSISEGHKRHWILDDNIRSFLRRNNNMRVVVDCGNIFTCCEDFVDRFTNVPMAGMNYYMFLQDMEYKTPLLINNRVYSCILLSNDIKLRWRGKYNEDTDLSIRILKEGFCTILFNAFLCYKQTTLSMKGGNEEIYSGDGVLKKAQSLVDQHPGIAKVTTKFNRVHHHVDYSSFRKNRLIYRPDYEHKQGVNNYGMRLAKVDPKTKEFIEFIYPLTIP